MWVTNIYLKEKKNISVISHSSSDAYSLSLTAICSRRFVAMSGAVSALLAATAVVEGAPAAEAAPTLASAFALTCSCVVIACARGLHSGEGSTNKNEGSGGHCQEG